MSMGSVCLAIVRHTDTPSLWLTSHELSGHNPLSARAIGGRKRGPPPKRKSSHRQAEESFPVQLKITESHAICETRRGCGVPRGQQIPDRPIVSSWRSDGRSRPGLLASQFAYRAQVDPLWVKHRSTHWNASPVPTPPRFRACRIGPRRLASSCRPPEAVRGPCRPRGDPGLGEDSWDWSATNPERSRTHHSTSHSA